VPGVPGRIFLGGTSTDRRRAAPIASPYHQVLRPARAVYSSVARPPQRAAHEEGRHALLTGSYAQAAGRNRCDQADALRDRGDYPMGEFSKDVDARPAGSTEIVRRFSNLSARRGARTFHDQSVRRQDGWSAMTPPSRRSAHRGGRYRHHGAECCRGYYVRSAASWWQQGHRAQGRRICDSIEKPWRTVSQQ